MKKTPKLRPQQLTKQQCLVALRRSERAIMQASAIAYSENQQKARLARLLSYFVAHTKGEVRIQSNRFETIPEDIVVVEHYDPETDEIVLRTGVPKTPTVEPATLIESVK